MSEARAASNEFSRHVYWELAANKTNNAVVSPFSVHAVLALASFGAGGSTATAMMTALGIKHSEALLEDYKRLIKPMMKETALKMTNKIYFSSEVQLNPTYQAQAESFDIELDNAYFLKLQGAIRKINDGLNTKTNGKLNGDLVNTSNLNAGMKMVLVNGLYFTGKWEKPFKPEDTNNGPFFLYEANAVEVPMMHIKANFSMYEETGEDGFKVLTLPYETSKEHHFSIHIILPNSMTGLATLEEKLLHSEGSFGDTLHYFLENSIAGLVEVTVPRFNVESNWEMRNMCKHVGMDVAFTDAADFSPAQQEAYKMPIQMSQVVQKVIIEVDEGPQGQTAFAVTSKQGVTSLDVDIEPHVRAFTADHPFLFSVTYNANNIRSNVVLFIGSVHNLIDNQVKGKFNLLKMLKRAF